MYLQEEHNEITNIIGLIKYLNIIDLIEENLQSIPVIFACGTVEFNKKN